MNGCINSMNQLGLNIPQILNHLDIHKRRSIFSNHIKQLKKERFDMQNLEALGRIENHERLHHLQNLQNLQNLQITNQSYEDVIIKGVNPIIYCDIPYKGTGEYKEGNFNHEKFYYWVKHQEHPVYISEYDAPFKEVHAFSHRSSMSATNNKKKTIEKIFYNEKGNLVQNTLF